MQAERYKTKRQGVRSSLGRLPERAAGQGHQKCSADHRQRGKGKKRRTIPRAVKHLVSSKYSGSEPFSVDKIHGWAALVVSMTAPIDDWALAQTRELT